MEERSFVGSFLVRAADVKDRGLAGSSVLGILLCIEFCFGSATESAACLFAFVVYAGAVTRELLMPYFSILEANELLLAFLLLYRHAEFVVLNY